LFDWEIEIIENIKRNPDERTIHWYCEHIGNSGKSTFCKYLVVKYNAFVVYGAGADMKHGLSEYYKLNNQLPPIIIIDIPRGIKSPDYTGIEQIKNGLFYNTKYEGGMIVANAPHIIIFSNNYPDESRLSLDRWNIKEIKKD